MTQTRRTKKKDWKRLRNHKLLEVFTHTHTLPHMKIHSDTHTHTNIHMHTAPHLLCIFICRCPHYMVPQVVSAFPIGQPLHELPYCPNRFCTIPLHSSTSIVESTSRYMGMNPPLSFLRNKLIQSFFCHWLQMEGGFKARDYHIFCFAS